MSNKEDSILVPMWKWLEVLDDLEELKQLQKFFNAEKIYYKDGKTVRQSEYFYFNFLRKSIIYENMYSIEQTDKLSNLNKTWSFEREELENEK